MLYWLDRIPMAPLAIAALFLGLAPFAPEPHLWEKLKMLADGTLARPIDIFDLLMHGTPVLLLALKLGRHTLKRSSARDGFLRLNGGEPPPDDPLLTRGRKPK